MDEAEEQNTGVKVNAKMRTEELDSMEWKTSRVVGRLASTPLCQSLQGAAAKEKNWTPIRKKALIYSFDAYDTRLCKMAKMTGSRDQAGSRCSNIIVTGHR